LVINNRTSQAESYGYYGGRYYRYGNGYHYGYGYGYDYYSDEIPMPTKQKPWRRKFFRKEKTEAGEN